MPGFTTLVGAGVLEWLVLQPRERNTERFAVGDEASAVGTDQMYQWLAEPYVAVQPEAAVHGVDHAVAALRELATPMYKIQLPQALESPAGVRVLRNGGQCVHVLRVKRPAKSRLTGTR